MAWPKGVPRKKAEATVELAEASVVELSPALTQTVSNALPDRKQFTDSVHYDEILAVRVLRKGQFRGLWELVRLDDQGKVKQVVTDANTRGAIITLMTKSVMKIVAAM